MKDVACFFIEGKLLYLDKVLVEFNDIPVLFICRSENEYFAALCTDIEEEKYIVIETTILDICSLLKKTLDMNTFFVKQAAYWYVKAADEIKSDFVEFRRSGLSNEALPIKGAYFEIVSDEIREYTETMESLLWDTSQTVVSQYMSIKCEELFLPEFQNYLLGISDIKTTGVYIAAKTYPLYKDELKVSPWKRLGVINQVAYMNKEEPIIGKISVQGDIKCLSRHIAA